MAYLKVLSGNDKGKKFEIDRDELVIGRLPENAIPIPEPAVSSRHCTIIRDGRKFTLKDLNSTNGTRLNGVAVKEFQLSPKDIITVGSVELQIDGTDIEGVSAPTSAPTGAGPQVTVRIAAPAAPATSAAPVPTRAFAARSDTRWAWIVAAVVAGIAVVGALVFFVIRLSKAGG